MGYAEAGLLIVIVAAGSVIVTDVFRRALGFDLLQRQHEVGNPLYLQIGVVFAVLLERYGVFARVVAFQLCLRTASINSVSAFCKAAAPGISPL